MYQMQLHMQVKDYKGLSFHQIAALSVPELGSQVSILPTKLNPSTALDLIPSDQSSAESYFDYHTLNCLISSRAFFLPTCNLYLSRFYLTRPPP